MPVAKTGKFIELPQELIEDVNAMVAKYGTTFTFEVIDALRRHVAYPPMRKPEPLPDSPVKDRSEAQTVSVAIMRPSSPEREVKTVTVTHPSSPARVLVVSEETPTSLSPKKMKRRKQSGKKNK
jgi:hypothetical protein